MIYNSIIPEVQYKKKAFETDWERPTEYPVYEDELIYNDYLKEICYLTVDATAATYLLGFNASRNTADGIAYAEVGQINSNGKFVPISSLTHAFDITATGVYLHTFDLSSITLDYAVIKLYSFFNCNITNVSFSNNNILEVFGKLPYYNPASRNTIGNNLKSITLFELGDNVDSAVTGLEFNGSNILNIRISTNNTYGIHSNKIDSQNTNVLHFSFSGTTNFNLLFMGSKFSDIKVYGHIFTDDDYSAESMFQDCINLTRIDISAFDFSTVRNLGFAFMGCTNLEHIDCTTSYSHLMSVNSTFMSCLSLKEIPLGLIDFSKVKELVKTFANAFELHRSFNFNNLGPLTNCELMESTFANYAGENCYIDELTFPAMKKITKLFYADDSDDIKVKVVMLPTAPIDNVLLDLSYMFYNCKKLNTVTGLNSLRTTNTLKTTKAMFKNCTELNASNLSFNYFKTSVITDCSLMFLNCEAFTMIPNFANFNTSNVTDFSNMFAGCTALYNVGQASGMKITTTALNLSNMFKGNAFTTFAVPSDWNTSNVTNMSGMFSQCSKVTAFTLTALKTASCQDFSKMFEGCIKLTSLDISGFNMALSRDISNMLSFGSTSTSSATIKVPVTSAALVTGANKADYFISNIVAAFTYTGCIDFKISISLKDMPNLPHEQLMNILAGAQTVSSAKTITLTNVGSTLTADLIAALNAKGWTVVLS